MTMAIIQARMGSSRLRGKVLRPLGGRPVLSWVVRAAFASNAVDDVVVATTVDSGDDDVEALAVREGARVVRGGVDDVLSRFVGALEGVAGAIPVVRLTADCPLLDPALIRSCVLTFGACDVDYLSTVTPRSLPRGLDVEVVAAEVLRQVAGEATGAHRAHVTSFVYANPQRFRVAGLTFQPPAHDLRVTLDTEDDASLLDAVVAELGDRPPAWREVVDLLRRRPDLVALNANVQQKDLGAG